MENAYQTSGKIFEQVSKLYKPGLLEQLRGIQEGELVVVKGQYDTIEDLLTTLKVPYSTIGRDEIATHNGGRVMYVNCATYNGVDTKTKDAVKSFVEDGGRLVTTDWSLGLVTAVFPGKLTHTQSTGDEVVEIQTDSDLARKFMGMNYAQCHPQWWLEGSSYVYSIGKGVTPIITSDELKERHGQPYVAVGFKEGKGEVLHFISHMKLQRTRQKDKSKGENLEAFLDKMKISKTADMDEATVAELEAAYSTLNTLAYLSIPVPLLSVGEMKSTYGKPTGLVQPSKLSVKLA